MTSPNKLFSILSLFVLLSCGGSSDNPESTPTPPTPTVTAPVVVSTTPANNATDVAIGDVSIQITYDKDVRLDKSKTPIISGANLKGDASVNGKVLTVPVNCSDYETKVTLTIPEGGLIFNDAEQKPAVTVKFNDKTLVGAEAGAGRPERRFLRDGRGLPVLDPRDYRERASRPGGQPDLPRAQAGQDCRAVRGSPGQGRREGPGYRERRSPEGSTSPDP